MYAFLLIIHIIASIFLIAVILLQAGRGSGLADTFGGSQLQSLFGTKSATILTRLTTICAVIFIFTCISLAIISGHMSKSLVETISIPENPKTVDSNVGGAETKQQETVSPAETQGETNETEVE